MSDEVLDEENWKKEAQAVIEDIKNHVKTVEVSKNLKSTDQKIYLNLKTLEGEECCVELSGFGFRIVGRSYDNTDVKDGQYFETPYGLLSQISSNFHQSFGNALIDKLHALKEDNK